MTKKFRDPVMSSSHGELLGVQIPLSVNHSDYERLTKIALCTKIPICTLAKHAIEIHIKDIETKGITAVLDGLYEVRQ